MIIGYDTETYKGYVKVLANSQGQYIESDDTLLLLDFLFETATKEGYNVFFNIGYDLASVLKKYIIENGDLIRAKKYEIQEIKKLGIDENEEIGYSFEIENYQIRYLNDKMFSIKRGKIIKNFWDTSNFYKSGYGHISLDYASQRYLGKHKTNDEKGLDRRRIGEEEGYYETHREKIIEYCIDDALLTAQLFKRTIEGYEKIGFKFPQKPYSEASIFKEYINPKWDREKEYAISYQNSSYFSYFYNAYRGGLFQTWNIGRYDNLYDIDINSAYPYVISNLYSVVDSEITNDLENSDYKFYKILARPNRFLPLKHQKRLYYGHSTHSFEFFVTEWDLKLMDLFHYDYKILNSIGIKTKKKLLLPELKEIYKKKFEIKQKYGSESVEYYNIKIMLNSGYGVFAQSVPNFTQFSNFIYASYITAYTRYMIGNFVKINPDKVIAISTDGILFQDVTQSKGIEIMKEYEGNDLGDIKIEYYDYGTQFANGLYVLWKNNRYYLKKRGYEKMTIEDLFSPKTEIEYHYSKPMRMMEAIIQKKYDKINEFTEFTKIFSPFNIWISTNPQFAQSLIGIPIRDFHSLQKEVNENDLDKIKWILNNE